MKLPANYEALSHEERREVRETYVTEQKGLCCYCTEPLWCKSPHEEKKTKVNWWRFPGGREGFLKYEVHLHHDHETGLTIGAVHAYCNAVSFDYEESPI